MKFISKNTAFLIFLSLILIIFTGCSTNSGDDLASNPDCMPDAKANVNCQTNLPKSNYPAAPAKLMQAPLTKTDGKTIKLEDLKGKVILVNLWATWCGPCVKEMPDFEKLYQANKDKGFEMIGLNADEEDTPEIMKDFAEKNAINYQLVKSERDIALEFIKISKVDAIPQSFLIDREGKLVGVFVGGGKNVEKIKVGVDKILGY